MAQINDIVAELNTLATAFTSVNSFYFDEISHINDDRKKAYPAILVDSRNIDIRPVNFSRANMPSKVIYGFKIFFLDDYLTSEQKTTTRQAKYSELETIANQFLAQVKSRTENYSTLEFSLRTREVTNGFVVDEVHNDKLVQMVYDVTFEAWGECVQGTFTGISVPPVNVATVTINSTAWSTIAPFVTEDIPVKDTDGTAVGSIVSGEWIVPALVQDLTTKFYLDAGDDLSSIITIDSDTAGTYTAIADDGSSGTITVDINSGGFGAFSNPMVLVATDTLQIQRTVTTGAGTVTITGTY